MTEVELLKRYYELDINIEITSNCGVGWYFRINYDEEFEPENVEDGFRWMEKELKNYGN